MLPVVLDSYPSAPGVSVCLTAAEDLVCLGVEDRLVVWLDTACYIHAFSTQKYSQDDVGRFLRVIK